MGKMDTKKTAKTSNCITLEELIKRGVEIKNRKLEQKRLHVASLDATICIEELPHEVCMEALTAAEEVDADAMLVYEGVIEPSLKDKNLQEAYGCASPDEIVRYLFKPGEIAAISKELIKLSGYTDSVSEVKDTLKNA